MCRNLKFVCKMVLIWFLYLFTQENRLLCLNLCCFSKTKVEMLKFAALMANCLSNNLWKFHQKILNYSEHNEIFVGGVFLAAPGIFNVHFCKILAPIYPNFGTIQQRDIPNMSINFIFIMCLIQSHHSHATWWQKINCYSVIINN